MPLQSCCIPGCHWSRAKARKNGLSITFFQVRRPDLAKSEDEKAHREALRKVVLGLRDSTKHDSIKKQLNKET